jgi:phosphoribosylformylglycinamidine synthase
VIKIKLKKGVVDPEGENTKKALELLGFEGITSVKLAKVFEIVLEGSSASEVTEKVKSMCERLLTNPVIHDYDIKII